LVVSVTIAVNACGAIPTCRLALAGVMETATGDATVTAFRQALDAALEGAAVVAVVGEIVTVATSVRFGIASSSTVRVTVNEPLVGAVTVVAAVLALDTGWFVGSLLAH
jgi:hypothetical protein